jgi:transposase
VWKIGSTHEKNSTNSHLPPSSDSFRPRTSLRKKTGKRLGGQVGHRGHTLQKAAIPHHIVVHRVTQCQGCGASLEHVPALRHLTRQVWDLPSLPMEVTQHECEIKSCPHCHRLHQADFPSYVTSPVQYGPRVKALLVYLTQYQLLPYHRTAEFMEDVFGHRISEGTMVKINRQAGGSLAGIRSILHEVLLSSPVLHVDETDFRVQGKRQWLHVDSTDQVIWYACHPKRGKKAMDDIGLLPLYEGTMMHDAWKPYFRYSQAQHALCNAHLLRELQALWEIHEHGWAKDLTDLLLEMKQEVEQDGGCLSDERARQYERIYERLLRHGAAYRIFLLQKGGSRAGSKEARKLLRRLQEYQTEVLRFLRDPAVPFANNQAERDLRMVKIRQHISGTFRGEEDMHVFCLVRSVISTIKKQKKRVWDTLQQLLEGHLHCLLSSST